MKSAPVRRAGFSSLIGATAVKAEADPLPSWDDGPAKRAIFDFVRVTTDTASPNYVAPEERLSAATALRALMPATVFHFSQCRIGLTAPGGHAGMSAGVRV